jgi:hypothetical protein
MSVDVIAERDIMREAAQVLLENLTPAKAARFWASWQAGQGDYLAWRDEQFAGETVATLYEEISAYQADATAPGPA